MNGFHGGYWAAWYMLFGLLFLRLLPSHDNPWLLALACFLFIPAMLLAGYEQLVDQNIAATTKKAVKDGFRSGKVTHLYSFLVGLVTGGLAITGVAALWALSYPLSSSEAWIYVVLFGSPAVALACPFLGIWWLRSRCKSGLPEG